MARARPHPWTVDDFLAFEAEEPERYEFVDGIVRMMTGASAAHSAIKGNIAIALNEALSRSGPCRVDVDDLKVVTASAVMYPDVLVICRPLAPDDDRVPDPTVVVEVLSPTTRAPRPDRQVAGVSKDRFAPAFHPGRAGGAAGRGLFAHRDRLGSWRASSRQRTRSP